MGCKKKKRAVGGGRLDPRSPLPQDTHLGLRKPNWPGTLGKSRSSPPRLVAMSIRVRVGVKAETCPMQARASLSSQSRRWFAVLQAGSRKGKGKGKREGRGRLVLGPVPFSS